MLTTQEIIQNNLKAKLSRNSVKCMQSYKTQTHPWPCDILSHDHHTDKWTVFSGPTRELQRLET